MTIKKFIKCLTLAAGVFAGASAIAETGDMYEVRPCDLNGVTLSQPYASITEPLTSGASVYFKVRLISRTRDTTKPWFIDYVGIGSPTVDDILYPLQIGIYVSGKLTYATLIDYTADSTTGFTDLVFEYKTIAGDFALPIVFAAQNGTGTIPVDQASETSSYYLNPSRSAKWAIKDADGNTANLWYWTPSAMYPDPGSPDGTRVSDYTLKSCGLYVKTIDFDSEWDVPSVSWRSVHEGSTITVNENPRLVAAAPLEDATTLYVWSTDESAVKIAGGSTVTIITNYVDGTAQTANVQLGTITIAGGETVKDFSIYGVAEGGTASIVLSAWQGYRYDGGNDRIEDYITVPVKCVEPLPASVVVSVDRTTATADGDYLIAKARLTVYLTQPYEGGDIDVTVTPSFEDGYANNAMDYVRLSKTADTVTTLPSTNVVVVTIPAGSIEKKSVWVYALRADEHTISDGHQMRFTPSISEAAKTASGITDMEAAGMFITAAKPLIVTPDATSEYSVTAGEELEINVAVDDTYADMTDTTTGYKVQIKTGSTASWQTLPENFKASGEGGELVGMTSGNPPTIEYPISGDQVSQIKVTAPISGKTSEITSFTVHVAAAKTTSAETTDGKDDTYYEGETVKFKITLSSPNDTGAPIYAFLLCNEDIDLDMFGGNPCILTNADVAQSGTVGRQISSVGSETSGSFLVLDGTSSDDGGMNYTFSVVLCSKKEYDPAYRLSGYPTTDMINIIVYNKEPTFNTVYLNGFEAEGDGYFFLNQYPKGQSQKIQPDFDDVSYDLCHGFIYKWTAYKDGVAKANGTVGHTGTGADLEYADGTSINDAFFNYDFPQAGTWTIKIQMRDKDMAKYSSITYTIGVTILDQPKVQVTVPEEGLLENATKASFSVGLGYYDAEIPIVVKMTVTPPTGDNAGILKLDDELKTVPAGYAPLADNEYYISFSDAGEQTVYITEMDGTALTSTKGFSVKCEVMNTETSVDPTKTWAEYYTATTAKILIENVEPVVIVTSENTNRWEVSGGAATSYPIRWQIRSDVAGDFEGIAGFEGIKVSFSGCENAESFFVGTDDEKSGTFVPNFGSVQGDQNVTLMIEDKDGGYLTFTYLYQVTASKFVVTIANGPSSTTTSTLSQRYALADGIGKGHTYVDNGDFSSAKNFRLKWNLGRQNSADIYAFGYKIDNPDDDGSLDSGRDQEIDTIGDATAGVTPAQFYHYPPADYDPADPEKKLLRKDSFLYCWLIHSNSDQGKAMESSVLNGALSPEIPGKLATGTISLPTEKREDGSYLDTMVEAVFSREWMITDNCGDINQDGVPDIFVVKNWKGGKLIALVSGAEDVDNDFLNLATANPDEDKLPGVMWGDDAGVNVTGDMKNSYAPIGPDFDVRTELRGMHDGLNAIDGDLKSDVDFSDEEQLAYDAYRAIHGDPPGGDVLAFWSPEPRSEKYERMDPTLADTDGDGFPDGWEYYFWYLAHVWVPAESDQAKLRGNQQFIFESFNLVDITVGNEIDPLEVEKRFNPCDPLSKNDLKEKPDFDGDGLSDLEELTIGTNPCHWDSDGDSMCDGWEVMMCLDPLNGRDYESNQDGDWMASCTFIGYPVFSHADIPALPDDGSFWIATELEYNVDYTGTGIYDDKGTLIGFNDDGVMLRDCPGAILRRFGTLEPYETLEYRGYILPIAHTFDTMYVDLPAGARVDLISLMSARIIHDQVHAFFGFDPRTGWGGTDTDHGYVNSRWCPVCNPTLSPEDKTGLMMHTVPYQALDEYLLYNYRLKTNMTYVDEDEPSDAWGLLRAKTTNPSVAYSVDILEESVTDTNGVTTIETTSVTNRTATSSIADLLAQAFAKAGSDKAIITTHGADTDGDGVPDGWELYVGRNPCKGPTEAEDGMMPVNPEGDGKLDKDWDNLNLSGEFTGTDSCKVYEGCPTIHANRPTTWLNKFFPTDPDNPDTDGDGIDDGSEGAGFTQPPAQGEFCGSVVDLGAMYGVPTDDGSCCIRGGGLNPLTVDTDMDGLPDPWEMSYIGAPISLETRQYSPPLMGNDTEVVIPNSLWVADGILGRGPTAGYYISGGMDPTYRYDVQSDPLEDPDSSISYDPLLGTVRDVDFDHDGLQNWQEYLVQTIRHLRYDDIYTPLMGRLMHNAADNNYAQTVHSPVVWNAGSANNFANAAAQAWYGQSAVTITQRFEGYEITTNVLGVVSTNSVYSTQTNVNASADIVYDLVSRGVWSQPVWKALGYFGTPAHAWDRLIAAHTITPLYLQPAALAYLCTSPKSWDTDGDGMGDYYELFHGLNPLLGDTTPGSNRDIIAQAYGVSKYFNAFWNEWTHLDYNRELAFQYVTPSATPPLNPPASLDPVCYPWAMGGYDVDADGDGLRNEEEKILANVTDPTPSHTDPTPLWFTDASNPWSYAAQYYPYVGPVNTLPFLPGSIRTDNYYPLGMMPTARSDGYYRAALLGAAGDAPSAPDYIFSFEQNEGYDTDGDWNPDGREIIKTVRSATDPLNATDPNRRQAIWFDGVKSAAMTRQTQYRGIEAQDLLRQFTAECWVMPERNGVDQTVLERSCAYSGDAITRLGSVVRANFRIGIAPDGRVYGMFDNTDAIESGTQQPVSCQRVDGRVIPVGEWSHVALTYDGKTLRLYMNGQLVNSAETSLIPANGVVIITQDPAATNSFPYGNYEYLPSAIICGARAANADGLAPESATTTSLKEYFQGYVDEVRIWDGARSSAQLNANYMKRFGFTELTELRTELYQTWLQNSTRNNNDSRGMLPPELLYHFNFSTLPSAREAAQVSVTPIGFDAEVAAAALNYNTDKKMGMTIACGWWNEIPLKSDVYNDYRIVPWIKNTVAHLPQMDGGCPDSFYYGTYLCGVYVAAREHGLVEYTFPNSANPYPWTTYFLDRYLHLNQLRKLTDQMGETYQPYEMMYRFHLRGTFIGTSDMLPLGGAYAKSCLKMWDGNGASAAWEYTDKDTDADGLPDWWEKKYAAAGTDFSNAYDWDREIEWKPGVFLAAYQAYYIDLARGIRPDDSTSVVYDEEYADTLDEDGDNLPDWWENLFGVSAYGADDDPDNDGLSNYAEYLLSFGPDPYGLERGWPLFDPSLGHSGKDQVVPDYFLSTSDSSNQYAEQYAGEVVTDHDYMEGWWEQRYNNGYSNARVYDALKDADEDGWSNWAECRAMLWGGLNVADLIDRYMDNAMHMVCYPEPAIGVRPVYHGVQDVSGAQLVIRTSTGISQRTDATFIISPSASGQTKLVGAINEDTLMHGFLSPGSVTPSSVTFEKAFFSSDRTYSWSWDWYVQNGFPEYAELPNIGTFSEYKSMLLRYPHIELIGAQADWEDFATSVGDADGTTALLVHNATATTIGSIDLRTGEWTMDSSILATVDTNTYSLGDCMLRITYSSQVGHEWPQTVWVSDSQELTTGSGNGHVREGVNTIEAFFDINGDGVYTAGEPFGVVRGVNVGWHKTAETVIELMDTHPSMPRFNISDYSVDRTVIKGDSSGVTIGPDPVAVTNENGDIEYVTPDTPTSGSSGLTKTITVVRRAINGKASKERKLMSKTFVLDDRAYIHEGDVLSEAAARYDLDWNYLAGDAISTLGSGVAVKYVRYAICEQTTYTNGSSTNVQLASFIRSFKSSRAIATAVSPTQSAPVYTAAPTFRFTCGDDTVTAYALQIKNETDDLIYDSGAKLLPGRTGTVVGQYAYAITPPIYADAAVITNGASIFEDGKSYKWRVAMLNAAFPLSTLTEDKWGSWNDFKMDIANTDVYPYIPTGYGSCAAAVRYYGPFAKSSMNGIVVVEAHRSADFNDQPLAQARVKDLSKIDSVTDITTTNALMRGIDPGTVYLMAYIDQNNNGKRDNWEPWGYVNNVGCDARMLYSPVGIDVTDSMIRCPSAVIYIEDCDGNGNEKPDCLEPSAFAGGGGSSGGGGDDDEGGGGGGSDVSGDTDRDGLSAAIENEIGTDSGAWDTDGDKMPDGWEYFFSNNRLDPLSGDDAGTIATNDVMAYAETTRTLITVVTTEGLTESRYVLPEGMATPFRGDDLSGKTVYATYDYGGKTGIGHSLTLSNTMVRTMITIHNSDPAEAGEVHSYILPDGVTMVAGTNFISGVKAFTYTGEQPYHLDYLTNFVKRTWAQIETNEVLSVVVTNNIVVTNYVDDAVDAIVYAGENRVTEIDTGATIALVHAQVFDKYGFEQDCCVPGSTTHTKEFTALDKYLVVRYLEALGLANEDSVNVNQRWASYTLMAGEKDYDCDGVDDGWELYVMFGPNGTKSATSITNVLYSPWNYSDARKATKNDKLTLVQEYDRGNGPTNPWVKDTTGDGITDELAYKYHLKGTRGNDDEDGDGLSNYIEYMLTKVFNVGNFNPDNAFSINKEISDYFFKIGELYVGEIFADHDQINDSWEGVRDSAHASRYLFDANRDADEDGWSNYEEFQAGTDPMLLASLGIDGVQMNEYPVPTIEAKISYSGTQNTICPIVVKAWSDKNLESVPNASWTIPGGSNTVEGIKYIGMNPRREVTYHLTPGSIVSGSMKIEFKDTNWTLYDLENGRAYYTDPSQAIWESFVIDHERTDGSHKGDIIFQASDEKIGEIDYITGTVTIDFNKVPSQANIAGDISQQDSTTSLSDLQFYSCYHLDTSYCRFSWTSKTVTGGTGGTYYLSDPDPRDANNNSFGHVRSGRNTFVAFADVDGDGRYTAGEPYGVAPGVDVGWDYAKVRIDMTDTSVVFARINIADCVNDREVLYGVESGNATGEGMGGGTSGGRYERVRVVRTHINDCEVGEYGVTKRVVLDKMVDLVNEPYLTEADFLKNGAPDIDWEYLAEDVKGKSISDITNVSYSIVLGNGDPFASTNNMLDVSVGRSFDSVTWYPDICKPITLGPGIVYEASPTFSWAIKDGFNSYTAFRILVREQGSSKTVWDSGDQPMPPRIPDPNYVWRYEWKAPIWAGALGTNRVEFANDKNYEWQIAVMNSRYRYTSIPSSVLSNKAAFRMNVLTESADYGQIPVAVKYFGPSGVASTKAPVRVQAFTTADFSGLPVAEGYVSEDDLEDSLVSDEKPVANATIIGLPAGNYFVRAFIDSNCDGKRSDWESWGCHCTRDAAGAAIFTPVHVKVGPAVGSADVVTVYIEDSDTDQDNLPDAWEYMKKGNLTSLNASQLGDYGITVNEDLGVELDEAEGAMFSGLAVTTSAKLGNAYVAALMLGVDSGDNEDPAAALATLATAGDVKTVTISSIELDTKASKIVLGVDATVDGQVDANGIAYSFYTFSAETDVICKAWRKQTIIDAEWTLVAEKSVNVGMATATIEVPLQDVDLESGFYKVTIEQ